MPYIHKKDRHKYDELIDGLAKILNARDNNDVLSGELNYVLFRLANLLCSDNWDKLTKLVGGTNYSTRRNYARMAVVSSALSEAQAEFRRRVMAPYEDEKIGLAGDIEL